MIKGLLVGHSKVLDKNLLPRRNEVSLLSSLTNLWKIKLDKYSFCVRME
jgi:hypothetical protein